MTLKVTARPDPDGNRGVVILVIAAFVSMIDRSVMPALVPVVAGDLGSPLGAVGDSLTAYAIAYAAFQLVWSTLATRFGRVRVLVASTALGGLANLATALCNDVVSYGIARAVSGAAFSATITTVLIYYGDTLNLRNRAVATANLAAAIALGLAAGTLGAGAIAQWWGWRWVYAVVAAFCVVVVVLLARLKESSGDEGERMLSSLRRLAGNRWALAILSFTVMEGALLIGVFNYLAVALQARGASVLAAGLVTAGFGVTVVVASQVLKLVLGHWPSWVLLLVAGMAITGAYVVLVFSVTLHGVLLATCLLGLAWALGHTTMQTWMTDAVADSRAVGMSFFSISLFVGASIGAAVGNLAAGGHRFEALFAGTAVAAVAYTIATTVARARYVVREG